ncbi:MAG: TonB-dependent receptor [Prevotellaceae bacterium]|jgi:TonB-linked SusC/RagA family outer membrane protein|nr:TonB-dependent receptor [Prevotellaceae bacterium]
MKRSFLWALVLALTCIGYAHAQTSITGKVTDAKSGEPVPFASVVVKGTTIGVTTDEGGNYAISVPASATTLIFSEVGHSELQVDINGRTVINVAMEPGANELDEVVVMGYTTVKKSAITGSVSVVGAAKIENKPIATLDQALQGNVPGLLSSSGSGQPGADSRVIIRGLGSINAGTDPLYVVDGVPITIGNMSANQGEGYSSPFSAMANLNPNDIESVNVLKDASATSIYGSRAANGVILISTKKGKIGKPQFTVNVQGGLSSRARKFEMLNRDQYIELTTETYRNSGWSEQRIENDFNRFDKDASGNFYDTNWMDDYAYRSNAKTYSADVSVSGGTEETRYFMSISNYHQDAVMRWGELDRKSARVNLSHNAKWINFGINSTYSYTYNNMPSTTSSYYINPAAAAQNLSPLERPFNDDGSYKDYLIGNGGINFVQANDLNKNSSSTDRLIANAYAELVLFKDLRLKTDWGIDYTWLLEDEWADLRADGSSQKDKGRAYRTNQRARRWTVANTLNYNKTIANDHNLHVMAGQEAEEYKTDWVQAAKEGYPSHVLTEVSTGSNVYTAGGNKSLYTLASYFGQLNYNYQNKYYFGASVRYDGSSKFGVSHRWAAFWSVSAAWDIAKEGFMSSLPVFNQLKLRTSYGTSGNSDIGYYNSYGLYSYGSYNGKNASYPSQVSNPNLTWESQAMFDIGIDFQLLDRRIGGSIDYYNRQTSDLLLDVPLSYTTGFSSQMKNIGKVQNTGIEISINAEPLRLKNFVWRVDAIWSMNRNKVKALTGAGPDEYVTYLTSGGTETRYRIRVGEDMQQYWLVRYAGVNPADGAQMWYDRNGDIVFTRSYDNHATNGIGSAAPKWQGSLTNTFSAYGFDLSVFLFFNYGNKVFDNSSYFTQHDGSRSDQNEQVSQMNRWQKPGDISVNPRRHTGQSTQVSTRFLYDGSYIRLRNATLGYNFPKSIVEKIKLSNLRVFVQAHNLFTITKFPGNDPEYSYTGENFYQYPASKTWLAGIEVRF